MRMQQVELKNCALNSQIFDILELVAGIWDQLLSEIQC